MDDDEDLCEIIRYNLQTEGYRVNIAYSAEKALLQNISDYDLLLLDVMLGDMSGFKMAHLIRNNPKMVGIPIVFLTAKDSENDLLTGYSLGADDYITKPFSIREMIARIKDVLKRVDSKRSTTTQTLTYDNLRLNFKNMVVVLDNNEVHFTKKEFEILKLFLENKNRLYSREELLSAVWSEEAFVLNRTIDVNITRIRRKIGRYGKNIITKLGLGYCFEE